MFVPTCTVVAACAAVSAVAMVTIARVRWVVAFVVAVFIWLPTLVVRVVAVVARGRFAEEPVYRNQCQDDTQNAAHAAPPCNSNTKHARPMSQYELRAHPYMACQPGRDACQPDGACIVEHAWADVCATTPSSACEGT